MTTIDDIRQVRDTALAALQTASNSVNKELLKTKPGPYRKGLIKRQQDLLDERNAILDAADEAVLALPQVQAAVTELGQLSGQMNGIAKELPAATTDLTKITTILSLGHQFADLITGAAKPS